MIKPCIQDEIGVDHFVELWRVNYSKNHPKSEFISNARFRQICHSFNAYQKQALFLMQKIHIFHMNTVYTFKMQIKKSV